MQEVKQHKGQDSLPSDHVKGQDTSVNLPLKGPKSSHDKSIMKKPRKVSFSDNLNDLKQKKEREKADTPTEERNNTAANVEDDDSGVPYDRGWAWVVDLACFILFFVYVSHDHWTSVLMIDFLQEFDIPVSLVTVMLSVGSLCYCLATQISTNLLVNKFSIRIVLTIAAIFNVVATLLFAAAPNLATFYIVNVMKFSVKGITLIACLILVGLYFRRRRGLATTLTLLGVSMSFICAPPMIRYLREEYGFRGCFLLLAGFEMHAIIAALLLRPLTSYKRKRPGSEISSEEKEESNPLISKIVNSKSEDKDPTEIAKPLLHRPVSIVESTIEEDDETLCEPSDANTNIIKENENLKSTDMIGNSNNPTVQMSSTINSSATPGENFLQNYLNGDRSRDAKNENFGKKESSVEAGTEIDVKNHEVQPDLLKDNNDTHQNKFLIGDTAEKSANQVHSNNRTDPVLSDTNYQTNKNAHEETSKPSDLDKVQLSSTSNLHLDEPTPRYHRASNWSLVSTSTMNSTLNLAHLTEPHLPEDVSPEKGRTCCVMLKNIFDISVLKNYIAIMIALMYVMVNTGALSVIYLPSYAKKVGVSAPKAALLLTVVGCMDIIGRLFFGYLADLKIIPPRLIIATACVCIGTITHFVFLFTEFELLLFFAVMQGFLGGAGQNLMTVLIVDELGIKYMGKLLTIGSLFTSFSFIIQHPIQGAAIQATGNFVVTYHYVGTVFLMAAIMLLSEPFIRRLQAAKERRQQMKKDSNVE